jgi:hypothetical protein
VVAIGLRESIKAYMRRPLDKFGEIRAKLINGLGPNPK